MREKKQLIIEYAIRSSPKMLFGFLSEPVGLSQWFADHVVYQDQAYVFTWNDGEQQKAELVSIKENKWIKFRWVDDEPQSYFEMKILQDELTNDVALSITDFANEEALQERKLIWDNQIQYLIRALGA